MCLANVVAVAIIVKPVMAPHLVEPSRDRLSNDSGPRLRHAGEPRSFPRCEPAFTHFELGTSQDDRPMAAWAKRHTPHDGARKE